MKPTKHIYVGMPRWMVAGIMLSALLGSVIGSTFLAPRVTSAQAIGNGAPTACADATLDCSTGAAKINLGNANTWTATQTFSQVVNNGLSANDSCVGTNGSKQMVDATCVSPSANITFTGNDVFQTGTLSLNNGATFGAPIALSLVAMTPTTGPGLYADASGGLHVTATSAQSITLANKMFAGTGGINMSQNTLSGLGHLGTYFACTATGTATLTTNSSDSDCLITLASSAATITFFSNMTGTQKPVCEGTDQTAAAPVKVSPTGASGAWTGYTIAVGTGGGASDVIAVHCIANGGS